MVGGSLDFQGGLYFLRTVPLTTRRRCSGEINEVLSNTTVVSESLGLSGNAGNKKSPAREMHNF
jgi:hypothetical protein